MEREEGEMSDDDNIMAVDNDDVDKDDYILLYRPNQQGVTIEKLEKASLLKIEERAKRFGIDVSGRRAITQMQIDELYLKCGISNGNERHFRLDTIHINGVDGLSTKEIFMYLQDYKPVSLEWIDDRSCNVVCQDHIAAALALLVHSKEIKNNEVNAMLASSSKYHWREGMPLENNELIFMRFATNSDKKQSLKRMYENEKYTKHYKYIEPSMKGSSKNPWGDLCQNWGVNDQQEILNRRRYSTETEESDDEPRRNIQTKNKNLAKRLGKRNYESDNSNSNSSEDWKKRMKAPRMRMHADDVDITHKKVADPDVSDSYDDNEFAPLSIEVMNTQTYYTSRDMTILSEKFKSRNSNMRSRLGTKVQSADEGSSDEDDDREDYSRSQVRKIKNRSNSASDVWSRIQLDRNKDNTDLRQVLKHKNNKNDLRSRIGRPERTTLRIEIDNDYSDEDL